MIYAFDRCFFIKNSDEKSTKKVLGERLYTNKRIKLDFSYDIVEENNDFVTRNIIDDYCKASKEIDDYEFCELMYKDYSAKPYNINISELPAIDKESEEYQNYNPPFKGENLRISDSVELTRFKEENFDEKYGIITNIYKDMNSSDISIVGCEFRYKDELNFSYGREKGFKKAEDSAILVMETFNTINGEKTKYFPVSVLDVLFGTNGMAFGNTLEEAKIQALSEVFERYCNKEIINKEIIMPQIPADRSIFKDRLLEEIVEVKEKTGLEITIYDASLGKGYPVISVIFENKENNTYFVKFGAHFDINVATERCLTEMFQGRRNNQSDYMKEKTYLDDFLWRKKNLESILHTGDGYYPVDVVNGEISEYKFEKWPEFESNSESLEFYTNKLLEISDEVYFKVYKEKGFNVVRFLIPQVSQIYDDIAYKMRWQGELNDISNLLERTDDITENELKDCIDFISNNCSSASNTIIPFFKHRFSYNSIFKYYNLYLLKFEYYIMCGKLDSAKEIMEKYKNKSNANKDILSAMTLLIEKIKGDSDNIKEYKMLLSNKLFKIDQLHSDDYCKCNICNCQKIKKAYDKFLIALPKGV